MKHIANMIPRSSKSWLLAAIILLTLVGAGLWGIQKATAGSSESPVAQTSPVHPTFQRLDVDGNSVLDSNAPLSLEQTCGSCHDTAFIESHAFHADLGLSDMTQPGQAVTGTPWDMSDGLFGHFDPLTYRYLTPEGDERLDLSTAGWLEATGQRVVGGGPATTSRDGQPLLDGELSGPEASILDPETGEPVAWDWSESGVMEMNCLLCHTPEPNNAARIERVQAGQFGDASTATLLGSGIVEAADGGWTWN